MYEKQARRLERHPFDALVDVLAAASRDDLLLAIVPVAFAVSLVATVALGVPAERGVAAAAVVGVFAIVDACYRNPPVDRGAD